MPSRRKRVQGKVNNHGLLPVPLTQKGFHRARMHIDAKFAQKLARQGGLFWQPLESASREAMFSHPEDWLFRFGKGYRRRRKGPKPDHTPDFRQVSWRRARDFLEIAGKKGFPLFVGREGKKPTRFRSKAFMRQVFTRMANKELRTEKERRDELMDQIREISRHIRINRFRSIQELKGAIKAIILTTKNRAQALDCEIRMTTIKMEYYQNIKNGKLKHKIQKQIDDFRDLNQKSNEQWALVESLNSLKGYVDQYEYNLRAESHSVQKAVALFREYNEEHAKESISGELKAKRAWLSERVRLHESRYNMYGVEMKLFRLFGLLLIHRNESLIRRDVRDAQLKRDNAKKELARLEKRDR